MFTHKIISYESAPRIFKAVRKRKKKIVQCHGTFDLIHPGHIYHLEEARSLGDVLVVTVTAEKYVNKGPGRPYFNDQLRAKSLAALACVDYVVLIPYPAAVEAIRCVKPDIYCKGVEYADSNNDVTENIHDDVKTVKKYGGEVRYIGSVVFSSSRIINNHFENIPAPLKEYCRNLSKKHSPDQFRKTVEIFSSLRVLIVGDIIFDRYSYTKVQGLTSKNRILSVRFIEEDMQAGGALAFYRHLKQFCKEVKLMALVGKEKWADAQLRKHLSSSEDLVIRSDSFTTVVKQRYVEPLADGKELSKLFSVNFIDPEPPTKIIQRTVLRRLRDHIKNYDIIVVADFGHGMMQRETREFIQNEAPFMALNCQTNSNNHGFNVISRQYHRADCFALDEHELMLSAGRRHIDFLAELENLRHSLGSKYSWLTRGGIETIGLKKKSKPCICLPLETVVTDTVGAGDAFFSVALLAAKKELPLELATFLGQLAGGQAVKIIGNTESISKKALIRSGMSLLNF